MNEVGRRRASRASGGADDRLVCLCNQVPRSAIVAAMRDGATTLAQIFDATFAGCGPCGGSCQPDLLGLIAAFRRCEAERR